MMSMLQNIPQFKDLNTQQDAEECFSSLYNVFVDTNLRDKVPQLFNFQTEVCLKPLNNVEGAIEEKLHENHFEFKC